MRVAIICSGCECRGKLTVKERLIAGEFVYEDLKSLDKKT